MIEGAPSDVDLRRLHDVVAQVPGVVAVHDLHVWVLTSGLNAMSAHAVLNAGATYDVVLRGVQARVMS